MAKRSYERIPMDPDLRTRALAIIEEYKKLSTVPASNSPADLLAAGVPVAMKTVGDTVECYDRGELSVTEQKQLIRIMKKIVKKYGG